MGVFQKIKCLLDINHMTISQLSKLSGVPVSTIASLKMRNSNRVNIETLKKIADAFGVSINYFASASPNSAVVLTKQEEQLILKIRALDEYGKKLVKSVVDIEFERIDKTAEIDIKISANGITENKTVVVNTDKLETALNDIEKDT